MILQDISHSEISGVSEKLMKKYRRISTDYEEISSEIHSIIQAKKNMNNRLEQGNSICSPSHWRNLHCINADNALKC